MICLQIMTLESEMRALEEDLEGMAGLLRQSIFTDPDSPPAEAVSELDSIQDRLAELKVRRLLPCSRCWNACATSITLISFAMPHKESFNSTVHVTSVSSRSGLKP